MKNAFAAIFVVALALQAAPSHAQNYEQAILAQLRQDGYVRITVTTTLLGRIRIVAEGANGQREIVLNPRTGEVLRDVWLLANVSAGGAGGSGGSGQSNGASGGSSGSGSSGSGSSGSAGGDDDDSDDDDSDDSGDDDGDDDDGGDDDSGDDNDDDK